MKFVAFLLSMFVMFASMPAFAQEQGPSNSDRLMTTIATMDETQKAALLTEAAAIKNGTSTAAKTKEWIDVGSSLGKALAGTARELGVAVNDFAKSPVGMIAVALIMWTFMGDTIVHFMAAGFCFILLFGWYRIYRNMFGTFNEAGKLVGLSYDDHSDAAGFFVTAIGIIIFVMGFVSLISAG